MSTTIDTIPVLDLVPDFTIPPQIRGSRIQDMVDFSAAQRILAVRGKRAVHTLYQEWVMQTDAEIAILEEFFHDRKGKWDGFFTPSWHGELEPKASILSAGTSVNITGIGYLSTLGALDGSTKLGNYVFFLHRDGTLHVDQVVDVTGTVTETITIRDGMPKDFLLGDYIMGFLYYVRFLNDEMDLSYEGPDVARSRLSMQEIISVVAEDDALESVIEDRIAYLDAEYRFTPEEGALPVLKGNFDAGRLTITSPPGFGYDIMLDYEEGAIVGLTGGYGFGGQGVFYTAS